MIKQAISDAEIVQAVQALAEAEHLHGEAKVRQYEAMSVESDAKDNLARAQRRLEQLTWQLRGVQVVEPQRREPRHICRPSQTWPLSALCGTAIGVGETYCTSPADFRDKMAGCVACLALASPDAQTK